MKFDILTVFPQFFAVLELSLVGKAQERGLISIDVHDLRDWTHDVHRTVDDSPFGGGAGMVMKADVWAQALDETIGDIGNDVVLAIPTPSGVQLTQQACYELAQADHIIIACGRYEGIDSRVSQHYAERGVRVFEYSLGDYVLNGGEVAATALIEAVGRLVPGMVGNPESLVEESHGAAGLLEYPVYTRPTSFRGIDVPEVLTSGNHGAIARWRRDRALEKTAQRRPDMIADLDVALLDKKDRLLLAQLGWLVIDGAMTSVVVEEITDPTDAPALSALASRLFPDACPPELTEETVRGFIKEFLSETQMRSHIDNPDHLVCVLRAGERLLGYTLVERECHELGEPVDYQLGEVRNGDLAYLSKCYLDRTVRGSGAFAFLMDATIELAKKRYAGINPYIWLGTNLSNRRAIKAYKKVGFRKAGTRVFFVGDQPNDDIVMARPLNMAQ